MNVTLQREDCIGNEGKRRDLWCQKTPAEQLSPQPFNQNLMKRLGYVLLSLPTVSPAAPLCPPLDHLSIFPSLQCDLWEELTQRSTRALRAPWQPTNSALFSLTDTHHSHCLSTRKSKAALFDLFEKGRDEKTLNETHAITLLRLSGAPEQYLSVLVKCMSDNLQMMCFCSSQI